MTEPTPAEQLAEFISTLRGEIIYNGRPDGHTAPLQAVTSLVLNQMPDDAGEPLLGPLVRRGERFLIGAATGEGKTTFVMQMVAAVVQGRDFLGWTGIGGRVLVIDAEQSRSDLKRLCRENGLEESEDLVFVHCPDGLMLQKASSEREQLEEIIRGGAFDMVVADPLYKLTMGANLNDQAQSVALMQYLDHLRIQHKFNLTIPVHCRKPPPKVPFTINEIHGAGSWTWGAETVVGLQLEKEGFSLLHFFKSRAGKSSGLPVRGWWGLSYSTEMGFMRTTKTSQNKGNLDMASTRDEINAVLRSAGTAGLTIDQMSQQLQKNRATISRVLKDMGDDVLVKQAGRRKVFFHPEDEPSAETMELWEKGVA